MLTKLFKYLNPSVSDENGVLLLSSPRVVQSDCSPAVSKDLYFPVSFADYGFDGEHHSRQKPAGIIVEAVINVWWPVEEVSDAVSKKEGNSGAL